MEGNSENSDVTAQSPMPITEQDTIMERDTIVRRDIVVEKDRGSSDTAKSITGPSNESIAVLVEQIRLMREQIQELIEKNTKLHKDNKKYMFTIGQQIEPDKITNAQGPACVCPCKWLIRGGGIGQGVSLGMAWAGEVGKLPEKELAILDTKLQNIAKEFIPPRPSQPPHSPDPVTQMKLYHDLIDMFKTVSLPAAQWIVNPNTAHDLSQDPTRHMNQRLSDALAHWRSIDQKTQDQKNTASIRLAWETLFQLIQFRGINLGPPYRT